MRSADELHVVFGAGPVGLAVAAELAAGGKAVRLVNRRGRAGAPPGVPVVGGDATDPAFTREVSAGAAVVYNCLNAPYDRWPELFPPLQEGVLTGAAAAGAKLVVMENVYMYGPTGGRPLTEDLPYAAATRKGRTRAAMAQALLDAHRRGTVRVAIGRASDFYGPHARVSAAGERVFGAALAGRPAQVLGDPDRPHTYTFVPDIGKGLVVLGARDEALGQAWHLPSAETVTTRRFIELVYGAAGHPARLRRAPAWLVRGLGLVNPTMRELAEMLYEFEEPFIVDHGKFARAFGNHATPLREAIGETVAWFRGRGEAA